VNIHQVEGNTTGEVSVYVTRCNLLANVGDSKVGKVGLNDRLVHSLVLLYPSQEIPFGSFGVHVFIVGVA
jgi:hypothetical protein